MAQPKEVNDYIESQRTKKVEIRYVGNNIILNQLSNDELGHESIIIPDDHPIAKVLLDNWDQI